MVEQVVRPPGRAPRSPDGRWWWDGERWRPMSPPEWSAPYQPLGPRTTSATVMVALTAGLWVLAFVLPFLAQLSVPPGALLRARAIVQIVTWGSFAGAAVTVPMWMHRAYRNLPALGSWPCGHSPRTAVVCWFVPLVNIVWPYLIAKDVWAGSVQAGTRPLLGLWWAGWILGRLPILLVELPLVSGGLPLVRVNELSVGAVVVAALVFIRFLHLVDHSQAVRADQLVQAAAGAR